jgi:hypothetical protein
MEFINGNLVVTGSTNLGTGLDLTYIDGPFTASGNNTFGTSLLNTHNFTGTTNIAGALFLNNVELGIQSASFVEFGISGSQNGSNTTFLLTPTPSTQYPFQFYVTGKLLDNQRDYNISGSFVVLSSSYSPLPTASDALQAFGLVNTGLDRYKNLSLTVNAGSSTVSSGVKGIITVPFNGQILGWSIIANQSGSVVFDIYKDSFTNFTYPGSAINTITGTNKPQLSGSYKYESFNLSSWDVAVSKYDVLTVNIDSTADINVAILNLYLKDLS